MSIDVTYAVQARSYYKGGNPMKWTDLDTEIRTEEQAIELAKIRADFVANGHNLRCDIRVVRREVDVVDIISVGKKADLLDPVDPS